MIRKRTGWSQSNSLSPGAASSDAATSRIAEVDVVRGMALGGMLLVNLGVFSGAALVPLARQSGLDWLASVLALLLAEGKFYPLFAFLFGWGIARQQSAARSGNAAFYPYHLRRMAVLALFGLLHAVLLWEGDILFVYALLGLLLPLLRRVPLKVLAVLILFALMASALLELPGIGQPIFAAYRDWLTPLLNSSLGAPGQVGMAAPIPRHLTQFLWKLAYFPDWLGSFAALIGIGYLSGQSSQANQAKMKAAPFLRLALLLAIPLNLFYVLARVEPRLLPVDWVSFVRAAALSLGGPLLALAYALGINHWSQSPRGKARLEPLRIIGRMPLTTYLCQSVICGLLFSGVTPGRFAPALVWPLAGAIFFFQLLFARWWLGRFERGPVETAWRWMAVWRVGRGAAGPGRIAARLRLP